MKKTSTEKFEFDVRETVQEYFSRDNGLDRLEKARQVVHIFKEILDDLYSVPDQSQLN